MPRISLEMWYLASRYAAAALAPAIAPATGSAVFCQLEYGELWCAEHVGNGCCMGAGHAPRSMIRKHVFYDNKNIIQEEWKRICLGDKTESYALASMHAISCDAYTCDPQHMINCRLPSVSGRLPFRARATTMPHGVRPREPSPTFLCLEQHPKPGSRSASPSTFSRASPSDASQLVES